MKPRPSDKFDRYEDGSVVFPNGGGYDPEERRNISPRERAKRMGNDPHSPMIQALIAQLAGKPGDIQRGGPVPKPPPPNVADWSRLQDTGSVFSLGEFTHPLYAFIVNALTSRMANNKLPVQKFPANTPLGRLQRRMGGK